ncbi:MAG: HAMP domain-containing sensor histidine kinase [Gammaproteobacteria bacterium]
MSQSKLLHTTTFRLALAYMVLFASSVLLLLVFIYWSTVAYMSSQTDATIMAEITGLAEQYRERGLTGLAQTITERLNRDPNGSSVYLFTSPNFTPLAGNLSAWPEVAPAADGWLDFEFEDPRADGRMFQARARAYVLQGSMHLLVGRDTRDLKETQQLITRALLWGFAITLALALLGGAIMSRGMLRRLELINQTSRNIMAGDLTQRIPTRGTGDEIDQLADSLNAMLDEIERLMDGIRHVSDNIAHDLRTPLTRLRNRLEHLQVELGNDNPHHEQVELSITDADRLLATFSALLRIARIEAGSHKTNFRSVDIATLVRDAAELYEALAESRQLRFSTRIEQAVSLNVDRDLLFQALINLLDNAVKYTPDGGEVSLELKRDGPVVDIVVSDSGPGIAEEERDKVVQRFYRLESSRSTPGSGLGLSLVMAVARLHHAELIFADNDPGLKVTLRMRSGTIPDNGKRAPISD